MRKHGGTTSAVLEYEARSRARRDQLADAGSALESVDGELAEAEAGLEHHVLALRRAREEAAPRLEAAVCGQLDALAVAGASFEVAIAAREAGPSGGDSVEFLLAPNQGVPRGPLREIASGGELSRVMLALITACRATASGETLVFDEIDAGIGGHAARAA